MIKANYDTDRKLEISGFIIERTQKRMKQHFQRLLKEAKAGITVDQWVILQELDKKDGLSQFELAQRTYKDAPTMTRIIDKLCAKGLIVREADPEDRRKFSINLTTEGFKTIKLVLPVVQDFRKAGWKGLQLEDLNHLVNTLNVIFENLEQE